MMSNAKKSFRLMITLILIMRGPFLHAITRQMTYLSSKKKISLLTLGFVLLTVVR